MSKCHKCAALLMELGGLEGEIDKLKERNDYLVGIITDYMFLYEEQRKTINLRTTPIGKSHEQV